MDVFERGMRRTFIGGIKADAVVFHDDPGAIIRVPRLNEDMQWPGIGIHTVLDGVFHDGLQSQWRQTKTGEGRIVFYDEHIVILCLLYGQVGTGMLQLRGKRYDAVAGNGVEIPAQVVSEIHCDLPGLLRINVA